MPKISKNKTKKIQEQILFYLYTIFPKQVFTSQIAEEIARDEEFTKKLLFDLLNKGLIVKINKNPKGVRYLKRLRWRLSNKAYEIYKNYQDKSQIIYFKT